MKKCYSFCLIGIMCGVVSYTTATANVINVNGVFDRSNEWAGYFTDDDGVGSDGSVGPGYGGQAYDVEYTGLYFNSNTLYFGIQTGFNLVNGTLSYEPGDFALDVDGDGVFDYAIDYVVTGSTVAFSINKVTTWTNTAISGWETIFEMNERSEVGTSSGSFSSGDFGAGGTSYTIEGSLNMNLLTEWDGSNNITMQWTMGCGNDVGIVTSAPVPEPATMLLFGTGLIGLAGVARRRNKKKA